MLFMFCVMFSCLFFAAYGYLLASLYLMFSCVFVTCLCGVEDQVWYLILSIPGLCLFPYFVMYCFVSLLFCNHLDGE